MAISKKQSVSPSQNNDSHESLFDEQLSAVYNEMRTIASSYLSDRRRNHELHTTAIVHETYLKLKKSDKIHLQTKEQFLALAAKAMRYLIIDFLRKSQAAKRKGQLVTISLGTVHILEENQPDAYMRLHEALHELSALDEKQSQIVELRFFTGLTIEETAKVLRVSTATVKREWRSARAWLLRELRQK